MSRKKRKCYVEEGQRQSGDQVWDVFFCELEKFIGLVFSRGVIEGRNFLVEH